VELEAKLGVYEGEVERLNRVVEDTSGEVKRLNSHIEWLNQTKDVREPTSLSSLNRFHFNRHKIKTFVGGLTKRNAHRKQKKC